MEKREIVSEPESRKRWFRLKDRSLYCESSVSFFLFCFFGWMFWLSFLVKRTIISLLMLFFNICMGCGRGFGFRSRGQKFNLTTAIVACGYCASLVACFCE